MKSIMRTLKSIQQKNNEDLDLRPADRNHEDINQIQKTKTNQTT